MKDNGLVQSVEKLGFKDALSFVENFVAHRIVVVSFHRRAKAHYGLLFQQVGAYIGSHDDNCVPEIDLPPQRVGNFAVLKTL